VAGERSIGLRAGLSVGIRDFGIFGEYLHAAPDLEQALIRARNAIGFYESHSRVDLVYKSDDIVFSYSSREAGNAGWRHMADLCICLMIDLIRSFVGKHFLPKYICLDYRPGAWKNDLEDQFGIPVLFNKEFSGIVFNRGWLEAPQIRRQLTPDIVTLADVKRQAVHIPGDFITAARQLLSQRMRTGQANMDGLAAKMGLGPRTFQRRLSDEGLSYQQLLANCRKERAADLLLEPNVSIGEISDMLGYSSHSHFTRAFKRWVGATPEAFRSCRNSKIVVNW